MIFYFSVVSAQNFNADSLETRLDQTNGKERVHLLNELASIYRNSLPKKSLQYAEEALTIIGKTNNLDKAKALNSIASYYSVISQYEKALENFEAALKVAIENDHPEIISEIYNNIGIVYYKKTDYDNALQYYQKALQYCENDILGSTIKLMNIGQVYYYRGEYDIALEYYQRVLEISEQNSQQITIAHSLKEIGTIYYKWGKYDKARQNFQQALIIYQESGNKKRTAIILNWLGMIYKRENNYQKAIEYQKRSLKIKREINNKVGIANSLNGLGISYKKLGDYTQALKYYQEALHIQKEINDEIGVAATISNIGRLYQILGNTDSALNMFFKSNNIARRIDYKQVQINNYNSIAGTYRQTNKPAEALKYYEKYMALKDSVFNEEKHKQFAEIETKYETEKKEKENQILKQQNELNELVISKQKVQRNSLIIISLIILISLILIYREFRSKTKAFLELKKAHEIINKQNHELELLNKRRNKFFSIISHDMKNMLTSLQMGSQLLVDINELDEDESQMIAQEMKDSIENLYKFLENLLEWSRIQIESIRHQPEMINLSEIILDVLIILKRKAEQKNINITNEINENTFAFADKNMIYSVIQNLITNAIKFTNNSGNIIIEQKENDGNIEISISDDGVGIKKIYIPRLFLVDETISTNGTNEEKGTGLGLILCKEFIEKNGGNIQIESVINKGTSVSFTLPANVLLDNSQDI